MLKQIYNSKNRKVIVNTKIGLVKEVIIDQREREAIAQGVHLQPRGKDEKRFFGINKHLKRQPDGSIINIQETARLKKEHTTSQTADEKENWKAERKERFDKFGSVKKWH